MMCVCKTFYYIFSSNYIWRQISRERGINLDYVNNNIVYFNNNERYKYYEQKIAESPKGVKGNDYPNNYCFLNLKLGLIIYEIESKYENMILVNNEINPIKFSFHSDGDSLVLECRGKKIIVKKDNQDKHKIKPYLNQILYKNDIASCLYCINAIVIIRTTHRLRNPRNDFHYHTIFAIHINIKIFIIYKIIDFFIIDKSINN
jgi:hypothetical protein